MAAFEDLSTFFDGMDAVDGTLNGVPVRGYYDAPAGTAQFAEAGATTAEPQFQMPTALVPADPYGKALTVPAGNFTVREHLPDGTGMSLLLLTKA